MCQSIRPRLYFKSRAWLWVQSSKEMCVKQLEIANGFFAFFGKGVFPLADDLLSVHMRIVLALDKIARLEPFHELVKGGTGIEGAAIMSKACAQNGAERRFVSERVDDDELQVGEFG